MRKNYNILFISHERKLGGATRSLIALAEQLQKIGHKVYVVVLLKIKPPCFIKNQNIRGCGQKSFTNHKDEDR